MGGCAEVGAVDGRGGGLRACKLDAHPERGAL